MSFQHTGLLTAWGEYMRASYRHLGFGSPMDYSGDSVIRNGIYTDNELDGVESVMIKVGRESTHSLDILKKIYIEGYRDMDALAKKLRVGRPKAIAWREGAEELFVRVLNSN